MIEMKGNINDPLGLCKQCTMRGFCKMEDILEEAFKDIELPEKLRIVCDAFQDIGRHR